MLQYRPLPLPGAPVPPPPTWCPQEEDEVQMVAGETLELHVGAPVAAGGQQVGVVRIASAVVINLKGGDKCICLQGL